MHRCFNPLKGFVEATDSSSFLTPLSLNTFGKNATHVDGFSDGRDAFGCVKSSRENTCAQSVLSLFFAPPCSECPCPLCASHSVAYLHHLFKANEPHAVTLATDHEYDVNGRRYPPGWVAMRGVPLAEAEAASAMPQPAAGANWIYSVTYGGGLVSGDRVGMDGHVGVCVSSPLCAQLGRALCHCFELPTVPIRLV